MNDLKTAWEKLLAQYVKNGVITQESLDRMRKLAEEQAKEDFAHEG